MTRHGTLEQLVSAARNLARSRARADDLQKRMRAMPSCAVVEDFAGRLETYIKGGGPAPDGVAVPCWQVLVGDDRLPRAQWCEHCLARQPLFEALSAERRKRGGYMGAILRAARKLDA